MSHCNVLVTPKNGRDDSFLAVSCEAGWNGGSEQSFSLMVRKLEDDMEKPLSSIHNNSLPFFVLPDLKPGQYLFIIEAVNEKGVSSPMKLKYTINEAMYSQLASTVKTEETFFSWIFVVAAILALLVVVICSVLLARAILWCLKKCREEELKKDIREPFMASEEDKEVSALCNVFVADRKSKQCLMHEFL